MLRKSTFRYIDHCFVISNKLWLVPFYWNSNNHQMILEISKSHYWFYVAVLTYFSCDCAYGAFVLYELISGLNKTGNFELTMKISIHWFTRLATLICHFFLFRNSKEIAHYYNKFLQFHHEFESKFKSRII